MSDCIKHGCRYLTTTCLTCGRVVCTAALPQMPEWISVKDRLPPQYHFVLVFCHTGTDEPCSYSLARMEENEWNIIGNGQSVWSDIYWGIDEDEEITHWMPLPEGPNEKE